MPRKKPATPAAPPEDFDTIALIARIRAGDERAMTEAYQRVFANEFGRLVLADLAASAGVGMKYGGAPDLYSVGFHQGGHDLAIDIMNRAGFDHASTVTMVLSGQLEGPEYERHEHFERDPDLDD